MRPRFLSVALILFTILAGLTIRFAHLGLPPAVTKYGGSSLWALMIYLLFSTLRPSWSIPRAAVASSFVATAVEFFKLIRIPLLDDFRLTLPGILLLGRFFSPRDIFAYNIAILLGAPADALLRKATQSTVIRPPTP